MYMSKIIYEKLRNGLPNPQYHEFLKNKVIRSEGVSQQELEKLKEQLSSVLETEGGFGIAANQIGITKRVCLIRIGDFELFLLNPTIKASSDKVFLYKEGCLCMPKTLKEPITTIRSHRIVVDTDNMGELVFEAGNIKDEGQSEQERYDENIKTLKAVVVQHEIDHLDGITIRDRVYTRTVRNKNTHYNRNDRVIMKSGKGEFVDVKYKNAQKYFLEGYSIV
jgi:peptide deformylase